MWILVGWHTLAATLSAVLYAADKRRARAGGRRVRERTLHAVDLAGGWAGGFVARRVLRHKTRSRAFVRVFWLTALTHLALLALVTRLAMRVLG